MKKTHAVNANGANFSARTGEIILNSALMQGIRFPHDCRAGRCGSCLTKVVKGVTFGGETLQRGMVHACQARVLSDLELQFDRMPPVQSIPAEVTALTERSRDVVELGLTLASPLPYRPGQYCGFRFKGFPVRSFSPTHPADGSDLVHDIVLHIKRVRGGRVSTALGNLITPGHKLRVEGPFGAAFFRPNLGDRLVLIAGGTGFAPIYSVAMAALTATPNRDLLIVVGGRTLGNFYMARALAKLRRYPNVRIELVARDIPHDATGFRHGNLEDHLPEFSGSDLIYAAGSPAMVTRVGDAAQQVGADFYCDPFEPEEASGLLDMIVAPLKRLAA